MGEEEVAASEAQSKKAAKKLAAKAEKAAKVKCRFIVDLLNVVSAIIP